MLSQMKRVKRLVPDHSASHWYSQIRRGRSQPFFGRGQPGEFGAKADKGPQKSK